MFEGVLKVFIAAEIVHERHLSLRDQNVWIVKLGRYSGHMQSLHEDMHLGLWGAKIGVKALQL